MREPKELVDHLLTGTSIRLTDRQMDDVVARCDEFGARIRAASEVVFMDRALCGVSAPARWEIVRRAVLASMGRRLGEYEHHDKPVFANLLADATSAAEGAYAQAEAT